MKTQFAILILLASFQGICQLNTKQVETETGWYIYSYHKNGKISTEEFRNTAPDYMAQGYARAYDKSGKLIYDQPTSRTGLLSSVRFKYYENGAVKSAEYNAHPDAGIQWYRKVTYFDEEGNITGVEEQSHDDRATIPYSPTDTSYQKFLEDQKKWEKQQREAKEKQEREQYSKDSAAFYYSKTEKLEDGKIVEYIPEPENGIRKKVISKSGKVLEITTEYFDRSKGVHTVRRTYHKNGRIHEEFIYEGQIWHYRMYSKKGVLVEEKLNQSIAHSQ